MSTLINRKLKELAEGIYKEDEEGLKRFSEFLSSPYHNKNQRTGKFCLYLAKSAAEGNHDNITEESVSKNVFSGEGFNHRKFSSLCTHARKLFNEYYALKRFENDTYLRDSLLVRAYSSGGMKHNLRALLNEMAGEITRDPYHSREFYLKKIFVMRAQIEHEGSDIERDLSGEYNSLSEYVDNLHMISKLEIINSFLSRKYHVLGKEKSEFEIPEDVLKNIEAEKDYYRKNEIALYTEYLIFNMMSGEDNERYFHELFEMVSSKIRRIPQEGLELVYYPLINYASNRVALGDKIFIDYIFRIYRTFEKNKYYERINSIQDLDFIGIIIIAVHSGNLQWAKNFLEKYSSKLNQDTREDTMNLSGGLIGFSRKKYEEAFQLLSKVNYINSFYYLKCKETQIKIHYETNDLQAMASLIDSVRHYIRRRRALLSIHYNRYEDFLKCAGILLRAKQKNGEELYKLRKELRTNHGMISSDWLYEKMNEFGRKRRPKKS